MFHRSGGCYAYISISRSQNDPDPATTSGLRMLNNGATASSSRQITTPGPSQPVARDYSLSQHELDRGMQLMQTQPTSYPSHSRYSEARYNEDYDTVDLGTERPEITDSQGQNKGKGKTRETSPGSLGDFDLNEFVDFQAAGPQVPETPDKGKGKGKQKRQQSSSESPPKEKESKKPAAPEKKKQRRGGGKS